METTGMLLGGLFRQLFLGLIQDVKKTIKKRLDHQFPLSEVLEYRCQYHYKRIKVLVSDWELGCGAKDCLSIAETVLMSDGTRKKIKDVVVGDGNGNFHPDTCETSKTKVVDQFVERRTKEFIN